MFEDSYLIRIKQLCCYDSHNDVDVVLPKLVDEIENTSVPPRIQGIGQIGSQNQNIHRFAVSEWLCSHSSRQNRMTQAFDDNLAMLLDRQE